MTHHFLGIFAFFLFFMCFFFTRDFFGFYGRLVESFYLSPSQPKIAAAHHGGVICRLVR